MIISYVVVVDVLQGDGILVNCLAISPLVKEQFAHGAMTASGLKNILVAAEAVNCLAAQGQTERVGAAALETRLQQEQFLRTIACNQIIVVRRHL